MSNTDNPYDLKRFLDAQSADYEQAIREIRSGRKVSHWMWYVFPQFAGLGFSAMSQKYAIKSVAEAESYLRHPVLGVRLKGCFDAAVRVKGKSAHDIFGSPDDMKLQSSATLFAAVSEKELTARLKPPSGGLLGVPATTSGKRAKPISLPISGASAWALA